MRCYVLTGDDALAIRARRGTLLLEAGAAPEAVERFDLTTDDGAALVTAAAAMSLFGGPRVLEATPASALTAANAARLADAAAVSDALVVLHTGPLDPAAKKALADVAAFETHSAPRTANAQTQRVAAIAADAGVTLTGDVRTALVERAGHDMPRVAGVLAQCSLIGLTSPTAAQITRLLGTSAAPGVPWALTDAIEAGDLATALTVSDTLEPVAVISYLGSRTGQLGRIVEDGITSADHVISAFGIAHRFPAEKLTRLAHRLGPRGVADSWDVIAAADRAVKTSHGGRAALEIAVCRLTRLWSGAPAPRP